MYTYKLHGSASSFNNKICHITNQVSSEAKVEEHIKDNEYHFSSVDSMEVTITNGGHGGDGPIHG